MIKTFTPRRFFRMNLLALALAALATTASAAEKMQGFALPVWERAGYQTPHLPEAMEDLREIGANYVSLHSTYYQQGPQSTEIGMFNPDNKDATATIEELRRAINEAHEHGLKVMLKPHVDMIVRVGWRGDIGKDMTDAQLDTWFASYRKIILEQARLAEDEGVELLAVGTELSSMQGHAARWRDIVKAVRGVYHGPIVYCVNHGTEMELKWWDAVDYIGVDAYYPLAEDKDATYEDLAQAWQPIVKRLETLAEREDRKILFTEIGYTSRDGTTVQPWEWLLKTPADFEEQANAYKAFFETVYPKDYFGGVFFWRWDLDPATAGTGDLDFMVEGKPAAEVVKHYFESGKGTGCCCTCACAVSRENK